MLGGEERVRASSVCLAGDREHLDGCRITRLDLPGQTVTGFTASWLPGNGMDLRDRCGRSGRRRIDAAPRAMVYWRWHRLQTHYLGRSRCLVSHSPTLAKLPVDRSEDIPWFHPHTRKRIKRTFKSFHCHGVPSYRHWTFDAAGGSVGFAPHRAPAHQTCGIRLQPQMSQWGMV